ncbi:hypothetical protein FRB98_001304, partial [Tulasnella sp. 332]
MALHIAVSLFEIIWYHTSALSSVPVAHGIPTVVSIVTSVSGLILVRNLDGGRAQLTRPVYQVGGLGRLMTMPLAYVTGSSDIYRMSIVPAHAFIYARLLVPLVEPVLKSAADAYAFCMVVVAVLGLIDAGQGTFPAKAFVVVIVLVAYLNAWASRRIDSG